MNEIEDFEFKKSFSSTAQTGITFHWLKCSFGDCYDDAVKEAIRIVRFPATLAASPKAADNARVIPILERSQQDFDEWMKASLEPKPIEKDIPQRVLVHFALPLDDSDVGKTLACFAARNDHSLEWYVLDAVLLVFLPVALSSIQESNSSLSILRSRTLFARRMDLPGYQSPLGDVTEPSAELAVKPTVRLSAPQESAVATQRPELTPAVKAIYSADVQDSDELETPEDPDKPEEPDDVPELNLDYDF